MRTQVGIEPAAGQGERSGVIAHGADEGAERIGGWLTVDGTPIQLFAQDGRWCVRISPRLTVWGDTEVEALRVAAVLCHAKPVCDSRGDQLKASH